MAKEVFQNLSKFAGVQWGIILTFQQDILDKYTAVSFFLQNIGMLQSAARSDTFYLLA